MNAQPQSVPLSPDPTERKGYHVTTRGHERRSPGTPGDISGWRVGQLHTGSASLHFPFPILYILPSCLPSVPVRSGPGKTTSTKPVGALRFLTLLTPNLTANLTGRSFISTNVFSPPYDLTAFLPPYDTPPIGSDLALASDRSCQNELLLLSAGCLLYGDQRRTNPFQAVAENQPGKIKTAWH